MKLAIMQPYFFPYLGYWQLLNTVDRFVIYDDVNFIKGGWINRNKILINGNPSFITVPLVHASPNKKILDISLVDEQKKWQKKLVKTIANTYRNAPFYKEVFPIVESIIYFDSVNLSDYLCYQLQTLAQFMGIKTKFIVSSRIYGNESLSGQSRVIDICQREQADIYINPIGGLPLYDCNTFDKNNIELQFLQMKPINDEQCSAPFESNLSIINALMCIGPGEIKKYLGNFDLITPNTSASIERDGV